MAEALHIDRDRLLLSPPDRKVPERFWQDGRAAPKGRAGRLHHRPPRLLEHRPSRRPRRARSASGFGSSDRLGDRAFRRHAPARERILDLGTGPGTLLLAALDVWPDATGLGIDVSRQRFVLCVGQCPPPWVRGAAQAARSATGRKAWTRASTSFCATRPMSPRAPSLAAGSGNSSRTRPCSPARRASMPIASLAPQLPRLLNQGGLAAVEIGPDQASGRDRACWLAMGSQARVANDFADRPRAVLLTWAATK